MKKAVILMAMVVGLAAPALAAVKTGFLDYADGNTVLQGYYAYEEGSTIKRPGVLVIHAWKGITDYEMKRVLQLADLGYVAFAADIYGKGVRPTANEEAVRLVGIYKGDRNLMRRRANKGLEVLAAMPQVATNNVAVIGYCFGGTAALELARSGAPLKGAVSFHGNLDTPNPGDAKNIKGPVLVLHGANDPYVPSAQVEAFQTEMRSANADWQMIYYSGAVHAFTDPASGSNPAIGAAYNATADRRSWEAMKTFFAEIFTKP